ncbi:unnamed protein product [Closterium sp. NIES-54]
MDKLPSSFPAPRPPLSPTHNHPSNYLTRHTTHPSLSFRLFFPRPLLPTSLPPPPSCPRWAGAAAAAPVHNEACGGRRGPGGVHSGRHTTHSSLPLLPPSYSPPKREQLLQHPFITKHAEEDVDLAGYIQNVVNPTERLKDLSNVRHAASGTPECIATQPSCLNFQPFLLSPRTLPHMLMVHYYMLFDGPDKMWPHIESFYKPDATLMFGHRVYTGGEQIFATLTSIRTMMLGEAKSERLVHTIENLECCAYGRRGVMVRVSGALVVGRQFIPPPGTQVEGITSGGATGYKGHGKKLGSFIELFVIEPGEASGSYLVAKQELYVQK